MRFLRGDTNRPEKDAIHPAYSEWEHAEVRLQRQVSILDRKDALSALNRAVLHRIKVLNEYYQFRAIPGVDVTSKNTELLRILGLARGSVLDLIRQLRNQVEHELREPPSRELCNLYLDAVWYFLRSTDSFLTEITRHMYISNLNNDQEADVLIAPPKWKVYLEGAIASAPVSFAQPISSNRMYPIEISCVFDDKAKLSSYITETNRKGSYLYYDQEKHIEFYGEMKDPECIRRLAQKYFSTF